MNDSFTSVSVGFGKRLVTKNRIGRNARPSSLIVLNTVIAIATPSMLRESVPVAVAFAAEVVVLTAAKAMRPRDAVKCQVADTRRTSSRPGREERGPAASGPSHNVLCAMKTRGTFAVLSLPTPPDRCEAAAE